MCKTPMQNVCTIKSVISPRSSCKYFKHILANDLCSIFVVPWWNKFHFLTLAAHSIPHFTFEEVEFEDYIVPKNTIVFFSHYSLLMDKDVWGDPEQFRPERFLDEDGNLLRKDDKLKNYVPYGLGMPHVLQYSVPVKLSVCFIVLNFKGNA